MRAGSGHLVSQHLENVSRDLLRDYPDIIRSFARSGNGIYALYRGDRLYYVGLATNLRQRLARHLRDHLRGTWDRFSLYLTVDGEHLREMEALFLHISKPRGNLATPRLVRSESLEPELRRRIAERQRQQRERIFRRTPTREREQHSTEGTGRTRAGSAPAALWRYVDARLKIRLVHRGQTHTGVVQKNGTIHYQGTVFSTPSGAARAITGVPTNGWRVWQYQRSPGEWVPLRALRQQADEPSPGGA
jgi:hypothetical protein